MHRVVEHRPGRQWMIGVSTVAGAALLVALGFAWGVNRAATDRAENAELKSTVAELSAEVDRLTASVVDAELNVNMHKETAQALREDLVEMHQKQAGLDEELTFYKSLMAPSSVAQGLQIAELAIEDAGAPGQYQYQLLLTQVAKRRGYIAGKVNIDVIGQAQGAEAVLSLTELTDLATYPLAFRFRYFQDLAGTLALPQEFAPERVLVTATERGKAPVQATFDWPSDTAGASVAQNLPENLLE